MKKILISAFSCLPNRGSEPGVGWNWAVLAAEEGYDVTVLTRTKCKKKIEPAIPEEVKKNLHFTYCDSSKKMRKISIYLEYLHWQWKSYKYAKTLTQKQGFDKIWFLTFGNMFLPIKIYKLNVPFVWGPIGGGEVVPKQFWKNWKLKYKFPHILKAFLTSTVIHNPFVMLPAKKAEKIIARTEETKNIFPNDIQEKTIINLETLLDIKGFIADIPRTKIEKKSKGLSLIYTGRLVPLKNVELLLRAFQICKTEIPDLRLSIIGDGNDKKRLEAYVANNHLKDVKFWGNLEREKTLIKLSESDIFVFPSLKEGASWSLLEAMALKKPIVCLELNGIKETTDEKCALRVKVNNNDTISTLSKKYADAIIKVCKISDEERKTMGENGYQRLNDFFSFERGRKLVHEWLD